MGTVARSNRKALEAVTAGVDGSSPYQADQTGACTLASSVGAPGAHFAELVVLDRDRAAPVHRINRTETVGSHVLVSSNRGKLRLKCWCDWKTSCRSSRCR